MKDAAAVANGRVGHRGWWAGLALLLVTVAAFQGAAGHGFLDLDDRTYVTANPHVTEGLRAEGVAWALRLSPHYFNTEEEIDAALEVVIALAAAS